MLVGVVYGVDVVCWCVYCFEKFGCFDWYEMVFIIFDVDVLVGVVVDLVDIVVVEYVECVILFGIDECGV